MAIAVDFRTFTPGNSRDDLKRRIDAAPDEHAAAILEAYELLQKLHEKEILKLLIGLLGAGDTVIHHVVGLVSSPEAVNLLRIALMLGNVAKAIDPDKLETVLHDKGDHAPSLFAIGKEATSADARRAMATGLGVLRLLGSALEKNKADS